MLIVVHEEDQVVVDVSLWVGRVGGGRCDGRLLGWSGLNWRDEMVFGRVEKVRGLVCACLTCCLLIRCEVE